MGLMSGTSFDGVDGVIFNTKTKQLYDHFFIAYNDALKIDCQNLASASSVAFDALASITARVSEHYLVVIKTLLSQSDKASLVSVIGVHGQTIKHSPNGKYPYTQQLINASFLATRIGLPIVCDFRSNDVALGGQGAPLSPVFHHYLFNLTKEVVILNLGGIANISYLDKDKKLRGFDTGPANGLMDAWIFKQRSLAFDDKGEWAASGKIIPLLLEHLLSHSYFTQLLPKSLDKETFSLSWLMTLIDQKKDKAEDVQATLLAFTVQSLIKAIKQVALQCKTLIVCGGGGFNEHLLSQLSKSFVYVKRCEELGYGSQQVEAMMMAWLAHLRYKERSIDLTTVTGASRTATLGAVYLP